MDALQLTHLLKLKAFALGFQLAGVASAIPVPNTDHYLEWLSKGYAGEMSYLIRRKAERLDPSLILPNVKFVFCVAISYAPKPAYSCRLEKNPISCYAWGQDYHEVVGEKLEDLCNYLKLLHPQCHAKWYVDTGPILEKNYAANAGLGWIGKNTLLLNAHYGSFLFLGEILTDGDLVPDQPVTSLCGSCNLCITSCPTGALEDEQQLNSNKCISYLTLEHRSEFVPSPNLHNYLAGCDICQTVCPYNSNAPSTSEEAFNAREAILNLDLASAEDLKPDQFKNFTRHSSLSRIKYPMWRRNIQAVQNHTHSNQLNNRQDSF
jgi:epoxyqueuosine reductase